jgi:hypothetical protein
MPRVSIYVSDALKERMDAESKPVNWSQVAAAAFDAKLIELGSRREIGSMTEVIERMRASKAELENAEVRAGQAAGVRWAKSHATWGQLRDLVRRTSEDGFWDDARGERSLSLDVYDTIDRSASARDAEEFWTTWADDENPSVDWLGAFCDGASEVHDAIADKI